MIEGVLLVAFTAPLWALVAVVWRLGTILRHRQVLVWRPEKKL